MLKKIFNNIFIFKLILFYFLLTNISFAEVKENGSNKEFLFIYNTALYKNVKSTKLVIKNLSEQNLEGFVKNYRKTGILRKEKKIVLNPNKTKVLKYKPNISKTLSLVLPNNQNVKTWLVIIYNSGKKEFINPAEGNFIKTKYLNAKGILALYNKKNEINEIGYEVLDDNQIKYQGVLFLTPNSQKFIDLDKQLKELKSPKIRLLLGTLVDISNNSIQYESNLAATIKKDAHTFIFENSSNQEFDLELLNDTKEFYPECIGFKDENKNSICDFEEQFLNKELERDEENIPDKITKDFYMSEDNSNSSKSNYSNTTNSSLSAASSQSSNITSTPSSSKNTSSNYSSITSVPYTSTSFSSSKTSESFSSSNSCESGMSLSNGQCECIGNSQIKVGNTCKTCDSKSMVINKSNNSCSCSFPSVMKKIITKDGYTCSCSNGFMDYVKNGRTTCVCTLRQVIEGNHCYSCENSTYTLPALDDLYGKPYCECDSDKLTKINNHKCECISPAKYNGKDCICPNNLLYKKSGNSWTCGCAENEKLNNGKCSCPSWGYTPITNGSTATRCCKDNKVYKSGGHNACCQESLCGKKCCSGMVGQNRYCVDGECSIKCDNDQTRCSKDLCCDKKEACYNSGCFACQDVSNHVLYRGKCYPVKTYKTSYSCNCRGVKRKFYIDANGKQLWYCVDTNDIPRA